MPRSRITIREVAAYAGVSHQTVSRVINNSERVRQETRQRVERAIAELGFSPNAIARSMAKGRTRTLACISPNLTDYTFASIIEGAEQEARQHGYFLLTASAPDEGSFNGLVEQLVDSRRTEGVIVMNPYIDRRYEFFRKDVPTVFMGAQPHQEEVDSVSLDDEDGGRVATQYLISLGHRLIANITGPTCEDCTDDRLRGYESVLREEGLPIDSEMILEGDWSATSGYRLMQILLQRGKCFSGLFAQNDRMAVGAIRALHEAGKAVPEDVSVIGFDDMPLSSYFDPPLTTMRQEFVTIGNLAANLLIERLEDPQSSLQHLHPTAQLIVRGSTAPFHAERR